MGLRKRLWAAAFIASALSAPTFAIGAIETAVPSRALAQTPVPSASDAAGLGFSPERLNRLDPLFEEEVQTGKMAGIVILVARHGKLAHFSAIGYADAAKKTPMQRDSIFRLYSMTKPIAATALMMLYEEGKFRLDDPVSKYIPEFKGTRVLRTPNAAINDTVPAVREPTIHDLFRHTAGLVHGLGPGDPIDDAYIKAGVTDPNVPLDEMARRLAHIPLRYQPGTKFNYSLGQDVQARLVEVLSGMRFDAFLKTRIFDPLGMKDMSHWVTPDKASRLAAVHWWRDGAVVPMDDAHGYPDTADVLLQPSDINSYLKPHARLGGSYGLTGTAQDYWRFAQMIANGGRLDGRQFLSATTVGYMSTNQLGPISLSDAQGNPSGVGWGLGFAVMLDDVAAGTLIPDGSFYWAGAANTFFWIDPKNDIVVVGMTQNLDPTGTLNGWPTLREQVSSIVYGALLN